MPDPLCLSNFPYLASGLGADLRVEGEAGDLFFNIVKFVKFIRK